MHKMEKMRDAWKDDDKFTEKLRGWTLKPPIWASPFQHLVSNPLGPRMTNAKKEKYRRKWEEEDKKRDEERKIQMDRLENALEMIGSTEKINTSIYNEKVNNSIYGKLGGGKKRTRRLRKHKRGSRKH